MHEQIEQLALRAGFNLHNDVIDGHNFKHEIEKFAQLIVQKCADIGERYADGNYEVRNQILEHFGVE
jgi:imidazoleglycerol phosphate dehydratase HisB